MPLSAGTRLGAYEIVSALGAGGMGEVYRAHDAKLNRDVALKVLPELFARDPDRLARFKREAQVLASLNHPNIAAIYGFEGSDGVQALVLELVEGPTLADRVAQGPIPIDEALPMARQIAEALEAAHEQGIIHRDLKPANIKVRPDGAVKVLDFGLAKALEPTEGVRGDVTASPTITSPALTQIGVILGTAAYLSPEQAKGRPADKRSDVWAFGAVLYEMLSGQRAFKGDDISDTLAAVLRQTIDLTGLPASTPAAVRRLVSRCLERDVRRRLRDIGEARIALEDPISPAREDVEGTAVPVTPRPLWRRAIPVVLSAIVAGILTGTAVWYVSHQSLPQPPITRFLFPLPDGQAFVGATPRPVIALSPDGAQIVYAANTQLFLRSMSGLDVHAIPGSEHDQGVSDPVFSPDGRSILFYASEDHTIKRIAVTGGPSVTICRADAPYGISWGPDGIVFGQGTKGIMRVSADGGTPTLVVRVKNGEEASGPQLLPGGQHVLFTLATGNDPDRWDKARIVVQAVTSGEPMTLIEGGSDARYVPTGHLVYAAEGTLFAVAFDVRRLKVTGGVSPVVENLRWSGGRTTGASHFSISSAGSLIYIPGFAAARQPMEIALTDRQGGVERLKLPAGRYSSPPRVSPDGKRIAFGTDDGQEAIIYTYDLSGASTMQRLTFGGNNRFPTWSSDSKRVAFQSDREGDLAIWQSAVGGTAERLTKPGKGESHAPESWHPKRDILLFSVTKGSDVSLSTLSLPDRNVSSFGDVHSFYPTGARFSPDGRWVAYASREPGEKMTIYVQPFPATGVKFPLFVKGSNPSPHKVAWSPDGKELFYVPRLGEFEAVTITTQPTFAFGNAVRVPRPFQPGAPNMRTWYDVTPSGKFVGLIPPGQANAFTRANSEIQVVLNWFEELRARVPAAK
jgi:eukaryotic-like serine/threonine-protein kinase